MSNKQIIDCHVHLFREEGYVEKYLRKMDELGIERSCVLAVGKEYEDEEGSEGVLKAALPWIF